MLIHQYPTPPLKEKDCIHFLGAKELQSELELTTLCEVVKIEGGRITLGILLKSNSFNEQIPRQLDLKYGYILHVNRSQIHWSSTTRDWMLKL